MTDRTPYDPTEWSDIRADIRAMSKDDLGALLMYVSGYRPEAIKYALGALEREKKGGTHDE